MKIQKYLEQSPVLAINQAYEAIVTSINRNLKTHDLNLLQGLVLTALFFEDGKEITPSQLAQTFQTSRGNISHILSHLEHKGWVRRIVWPSDARKFQIELRAEGRRKALILIKFYDRLQNHFEQEISTQICTRTVESLQHLIQVYQDFE